MAREDAFNAAKAGFGAVGGFFKDVAQEIGMEKALAFYAKQSATFGAMMAGMTKEQLGDKEFDMKTFASVLSGGYQVFGFASEIEENPASLKITVSQCPIYEGLKSAGLDDKTIELLCSRGAAAEFAEEKKLSPQLSMCLKFRSAPDQPCVQEYALEK